MLPRPNSRRLLSNSLFSFKTSNTVYRMFSQYCPITRSQEQAVYSWRTHDVILTWRWCCWRVFVPVHCYSPSGTPCWLCRRKCRSVASFCRSHPPPHYPSAYPPVSVKQMAHCSTVMQARSSRKCGSCKTVSQRPLQFSNLPPKQQQQQQQQHPT